MDKYEIQFWEYREIPILYSESIAEEELDT